MVRGQDVLDAAHHVPLLVKYTPLALAISGIIVAFWFYLWCPSIPRALATKGRWLHRLSSNKWYVDHLYDFVFVRGANWLGAVLYAKGDRGLIDGLGPDGIAAGASAMGDVLSRFQNGYLFRYAFVMVLALIIVMMIGLFVAGIDIFPFISWVGSSL
jgi:NADH-quinone oxidoreductase subunit L